MESFLTFISELIFYITLPVMLIYSWIFSYHWYQYGVSKKSSLVLTIVFLSVSAILLLIMFFTSVYVNR